MKSNLILTASAIAAMFAISACSNDEPVPDVPDTPIALSRSEAEIVKAQNEFSAQLLREVYTVSEGENALCSPLSASMCLSMLATGAEGNTQSEILSTLGFDSEDMEAANVLNTRLRAELPAVDKLTKINIANSLWIDKSFTVNEPYIEGLRADYNAEIFHEEMTQSVDKVNGWMSKNTFGLITELDNSLIMSSRFLLMNTLYFKGTWVDKFDKDKTRKGLFTDCNNNATSVEMMNAQWEKYVVTDGERGYSALRLPYGNESYTMVMMLPDANHSVADVLSALDADVIEKCNNGGEIYDVKLSMPKFDIEKETILTGSLFNMGIHDAFDRSGGKFPKISDDLAIGGVLQKMRIIVDETGTEAAAVTAIPDYGANLNPSITLTFDKPYIFYIFERSSNAVLFMGVVNKL